MEGWTKEEYKAAIKQCLMQRRLHVTLEMNDCPEENIQELIQWAIEDGYEVEYDVDGVHITLLTMKGFFR